MITSASFVAEISLNLADKLKAGLIEQGFELSTPPHALFSGKKSGVSCTLYQSGKLVVQGKDKGPFIEFFLEPEILQSFASLDLTPRIGSDEAGKGDYFGPLCVAGVYADEKAIEELAALGVKDSKMLNDKIIVKMAYEIARVAKVHSIRLMPPKYNELYAKFNNLNHLLAWCHSQVIEELHKESNCKRVIVDQFAYPALLERFVARHKRELDLIQMVRAEADIVVAAASICARAKFVKAMEQLSEQAGMELPKGASAAVKRAAHALYRQVGKEGLEQYCKLHFKTTEELC